MKCSRYHLFYPVYINNSTSPRHYACTTCVVFPVFYQHTVAWTASSLLQNCNIKTQICQLKYSDEVLSQCKVCNIHWHFLLTVLWCMNEVLISISRSWTGKEVSPSTLDGRLQSYITCSYLASFSNNLLYGRQHRVVINLPNVLYCHKAVPNCMSNLRPLKPQVLCATITIILTTKCT